MWAIVNDNEITETFSNIRALRIGEVQYSRNIFSFRWSEAERNAIGVYTIVQDNSNYKDGSLYTNTDISYAFADGKVTASYGTATARELEDTVNEDDSITQGLKSQKKANIKQQASSLLAPTDWYVVKAAEVESYSVPEAMTTYRADVRTASNSMESKIDACSTVDELAVLYQHVNTGTEENPVMERPLGEFPEAV